MKDFYCVLGVQRDASAEQITAAYRRLALKFHPDKNLDCPDWAAGLFRDVREAYSVLSDPAKRAAYDRPVLKPLIMQVMHRRGVDDPLQVALAEFLVAIAKQSQGVIQRKVAEVQNDPSYLDRMLERIGLIKRRKRRAKSA